MKTTGLLFTAQMVCRTLELRKRQTRRVVTLRPEHAGGRRGQVPDECYTTATVGEFTIDETTKRHYGVMFRAPNGADLFVASPYGRPGDRIRVRENYRFPKAADKLKPRDVPRGCLRYFPAGGGPLPLWAGKLRPGIFLPNWASRISLEIESLRVERVQHISRSDTLLEGIDRCRHCVGYDGGNTGCFCVDVFGQLWDSINASRGYAWERNNWVWAIGFKVVE